MRARLLFAILLAALLPAACGPAPAAPPSDPTTAAASPAAPTALPTATSISPVMLQDFSLPPDELQAQVKFPLLGLSFIPFDLFGGDQVRLKTFGDGSQTVETTFRETVPDPGAVRKIIFTQSDLPLDEAEWFRALAPGVNRREALVRGAVGRLFKNRAGQPSLFWQENGLTYSLRLEGQAWPAALNDDTLLWLAESLQPADDGAFVFEHRAPRTWFAYTSAAYHIAFAVPRDWEQTGDAAFSGENGFARLETFKSYGTRLDQACEMEANLHPERYGSRPALRSLRQQWGVADVRFDPCLILPGADAPAAAEAALLLPDPTRPGQPAFLRLALDPPHAELIAFSVDLPHDLLAVTPSALVTPNPANLPQTIEPLVSRLGPLTMESYPIVAASQDSPGHFEFEARVPAAVLARRAGLRGDALPAGSLSITSAGRAVTVTEEVDSIDHHYAVVSVDGREAFRYSLLQHAGSTPIYGLWDWAGRWALEVNGALVVEGELYNHKAGYREIFNFRMLAGKPFFFFFKEGRTGIFYDGQTWPGLFDEIFHGACCEPAIANPRGNDAMLWFYARQQDWWHYVELGPFAKQSP
ncbi:MAG: hypothetical protein AAGU05_02760 [Anaerolineaceae bacterium]